MTASSFHDISESLTPAALKACKRIVQYMHQQRLEPGDTLPPQQTLHRKFRITNDALSRAMRWLCEQRVIERKPRMGTRLLNLANIGQLPWTVGLANIAAPPIGPLSVFTTLAHHLQVHFAKAGWSVQTFYRHTNDVALAKQEDFDFLGASLARQSLDGLVLLTTLAPDQWQAIENTDVPVCHTLFWEDAPCGVMIDQQAMTHQAIVSLASQGCRTLAVVQDRDAQGLFKRYKKGIKSGLKEAGLAPNACTDLVTGISTQGGHELGSRLLQMPARLRPEGLILHDDFIAMALTHHLKAHAERKRGHEAYQPRIAVISHRELPQNYHLPVTRFEVSLEDLATDVLAIMRQRLLNPWEQPPRRWVGPTPVQSTLAAGPCLLV